MKNTRTRLRAVVGGGIVAALATVGLASVSGAAESTTDPGVTANSVKIGYIYPATGVAASISQNGIKGFQARIDADTYVSARSVEAARRAGYVARDAMPPQPWLSQIQTQWASIIERYAR